MKALTILQPYAHLIVRGEKRVENRTWPTRYRGDLLIHAGKGLSMTDSTDIASWERNGDPMVFGSAVGVATLIDVLHIEKIRSGGYDKQYPWLREHKHAIGTWCWVLENARRIEPIPWKGAQGLWDFPAAALAL